MTGYGADCQGCSGLGTLACKTKNGSYYSLTQNGMNYTDDEYGEVRIIAAALDKFPCGTIIKVDNPNLGTFNAYRIRYWWSYAKCLGKWNSSHGFSLCN